MWALRPPLAVNTIAVIRVPLFLYDEYSRITNDGLHITALFSLISLYPVNYSIGEREREREREMYVCFNPYAAAGDFYNTK